MTRPGNLTGQLTKGKNNTGTFQIQQTVIGYDAAKSEMKTLTKGVFTDLLPAHIVHWKKYF